MAQVLTDLFSLYTFREVCNTTFKKEKIDSFVEHFSIIENLILCEKVIVEKNGVRHFDLELMCDSMSDAFGYITDERLYDKLGTCQTQLAGGDICHRGLLYADIARDNDLYFSPHPRREKILSDKIDKYIATTAANIINHVDQAINESKSGEISNINIKIPPVVEHALYLSKTQNISIIGSINEIRNSKNAKQFRLYINELDEELKELSPRKRVSVYQPLFEDIDRLCKVWSHDMNEEVKFRKRRIKLSKIPVIGSMLEALGKGEIEIKDPIILSSKPHLLFINELYQKVKIHVLRTWF